MSAHALAGIVEAFKKYPKISLLTGDKDWPVTNWDASLIQQNLTALLSKYPKIDAVINDSDGFAALGVVRAYQSANKPLVPLASLEANGLACEYMKLKAANPGFQIGTISGRNWIGRVAARKAIAAAEGLPNDEPTGSISASTRIPLGGRAPSLRPAQGPDAFTSVGAERRRARQIRQGRVTESARTGDAEPPTVLRLTDVVKTFPRRRRARRRQPGGAWKARCMPSLGENGAGKSTLMAVAAGATRARLGADRDRRAAARGGDRRRRRRRSASASSTSTPRCSRT